MGGKCGKSKKNLQAVREREEAELREKEMEVKRKEEEQKLEDEKAQLKNEQERLQKEIQDVRAEAQAREEEAISKRLAAEEAATKALEERQQALELEKSNLEATRIRLEAEAEKAMHALKAAEKVSPPLSPSVAHVSEEERRVFDEEQAHLQEERARLDDERRAIEEGRREIEMMKTRLQQEAEDAQKQLLQVETQNTVEKQETAPKAIISSYPCDFRFDQCKHSVEVWASATGQNVGACVASFKDPAALENYAKKYNPGDEKCCQACFCGVPQHNRYRCLVCRRMDLSDTPILL